MAADIQECKRISAEFRRRETAEIKQAVEKYLALSQDEKAVQDEKRKAAATEEAARYSRRARPPGPVPLFLQKAPRPGPPGPASS